ncbi:hypothetical protein [Streptomyces sp. NPDC087856]|uniref:hypothetical protein n=1 Tax=Streptomyces sp. NPDC087856 TaxID=3365811 RepID=UPI00382E6A24
MGRRAQPGFSAGVLLRYPEADDAHGRGLLLVDSITKSWYVAEPTYGNEAQVDDPGLGRAVE